MNLLLTIKLALNNIRGNKLRSGLTMLGLVIGIASVIILVGIGNGATKNVQNQVSSLGADVLTVTISNSDTTLDYADLDGFTSLRLIESAAPYVTVSATVSRNTETSEQTSLIATNDNYLDVMDYQLSKGRTISEIDIENCSKVVIIGSSAAEDLFGLTDPLGETVKIDGDNYTVIGVLEGTGSSMGNNVDDMLLMPITTVKYLGDDAGISNLYLNAKSDDVVEDAANEVEQYLTQTYALSADDDFSVSTQESMLEAMEDITNTMSLLLGGIAGISLLVGGIGVMNVMLVSVSERTKEIGIRKSLGAKRADILKQFLIEALVLSLFGGIIGIMVGIIGGFASEVFGVSFAPGIGVVLLSFTVSAAVGLVFGIFPSYRAAGLRPIDALKQE